MLGELAERREAPPLIRGATPFSKNSLPKWYDMAGECETKYCVNNYISSVKGEEDHGQGAMWISA